MGDDKEIFHTYLIKNSRFIFKNVKNHETNWLKLIMKLKIRNKFLTEKQMWKPATISYLQPEDILIRKTQTKFNLINCNFKEEFYYLFVTEQNLITPTK